MIVIERSLVHQQSQFKPQIKRIRTYSRSIKRQQINNSQQKKKYQNNINNFNENIHIEELVQFIIDKLQSKYNLQQQNLIHINKDYLIKILEIILQKSNKYSNNELKNIIQLLSININKQINHNIHYKFNNIKYNTYHQPSYRNKQNQLQIQSIINQQISPYQQKYHQINNNLSHLTQLYQSDSQPNKLTLKIFKKYQYIQKQLFNYAQNLIDSRFGAHTYIPQIQLTQLQNSIDQSLQHLIKDIQQNNYTIQLKCMMLKDTAKQIRKSYSTILSQFIKVINIKTNSQKQFVSKILKWRQQNIIKKKYLNKLKQQYHQTIIIISNLLSSLQFNNNNQQFDQKIKNLSQNIHKIIQAFQLGNPIY